MRVQTPISVELDRYLNLSSAQLKLTAENMANVDTPGYRTVGFDFGAEMESSIAALRTGWTKNASGRPGGGGGAAGVAEDDGDGAPDSPGLYAVDGLLERPDGNNVSMDREGLKMADAQLKFRTGVELLKREFARVSDAIHIDK